jgi:hypothetical protein
VPRGDANACNDGIAFVVRRPAVYGFPAFNILGLYSHEVCILRQSRYGWQVDRKKRLGIFVDCAVRSLVARFLEDLMPAMSCIRD